MKLNNLMEKEEEAANNMGKQKRKQLIDDSLSENQSESLECHGNAGKKHFNSNSMTIPFLASLSTSKMLTETGKTSVSRCSLPPISREHCSDDPVDTAIQVQAGSVVEEEAHEAEDILEEEEHLAKDTHRSPSPSSSNGNLKLTEIVNMLDDKDNEVNSVAQSSPVDTVQGYQVKLSSMPMLRKILNKHGDIVENCSVLTTKYCSKLLEAICDIVSDLEEKEFRKIKDDDLHNMIAFVDELKTMMVDIEWLHLRLVEILEARRILTPLEEEKDSNRKDIDAAEREVGECESQRKELEAKFHSICYKETKETLERAKEQSIKIKKNIKEAISKVEPFYNCSLVDDLL